MSRHGGSRAGARPSLDKKPGDVTAMFDRVAPRYDLLNLLMTGGYVTRWRRSTTRAIAPRPGERILDVAAGTGASAAPLLAAGADVVAVDPSLGMVAEGRRRHPGLTFVEAGAHHLPFPDGHFDAVTITFGLRNIGATELALKELRRVCRPGGRLVVAEFSTPTSRLLRAGHQGVVRLVLPLLGRVASSDPAAYGYLAESVLDWPDQVRLARLITRSGWRDVGYRNLSGGIVALHRGWRRDGEVTR